MGRACSTHGDEEEYIHILIGFWSETQKDRDYQEDLYIGGG
jgi:hypothetical protein